MGKRTPEQKKILFEKIEKELNEKKGITGNSTATVNWIIDLLKSCVATSTPKIRQNTKDIDPIKQTNRLGHRFSELALNTNFSYNKENHYMQYAYQFAVPVSAVIDEWMSEESKLVIVCRVYDSKKDLLDDPKHKGSISSKHHIEFSSNEEESGKSVAQIYIIICFAPRTKYYMGGYSFEYIENFIPQIQHEINHIHKTTIRWTETDTKLYQYIIDVINDDSNTISPLTKTFAQLLYRYAVDTEREAFTEQFYKEYMQEFNKIVPWMFDRQEKMSYLKSISYQNKTDLIDKTSVIKDLNTLREWLNKNESKLIFPHVAKEICNYLKGPIIYFLELQDSFNKSEIEIVKDSIPVIRKMMNLFYKRCERTTHVSERYYDRGEYPLCEQIEYLKGMIY